MLINKLVCKTRKWKESLHMASLFKRGKMWYVAYQDPNGRRVRTAVSKYKETAHLILKKIEVDIAEGKYLDVQKRDPITFKDFAEKLYRKHIKRRNRSARNQKYLLDQLVRYFGKKMMHEITVSDIDDYLEIREEKFSPSTVNKDLSMIKSMFNRADEWGDLINYNPPQKIKFLPENNERCRYLLEEEQGRLLFSCSGVLRMIVLVALRTGLRWGEIMNLKWGQAPQSNYVDFRHNTIFIHESLAKSKRSRYVPLASSVKQALMDFPQHSESGYIFVNTKTGKPYNNVKRSFRTALREAGIENFRFHDLRHCFASDLVRKGADLFGVQKLLGHSRPEMTQRYAHLGHDQLRELISLLDDKKDDIFNFGRRLAPTSCNIKK